MRNRTFFRALLLAVPLLLPASQIRFTTLPQNTENGTFNGFSGGTIDGTPFNNLVCDDYADTTYFPSGPFAYNVGSIDDLAAALFAGPPDAGVTRYRAAALLLDGMAADPARVAAYQYALWDLFTPAAPAYQDSTALVGEALSLAAGPPGGYASLYQRLVVYTPADSHNQEFLQLRDAAYSAAMSEVPEAGTGRFALIGLALVAVALVLRKKWRRPV